MKPGNTLMPEMLQPMPQPAPSALPASMPTPWLILPFLSGALLWLCFYPLGWGFLGWVALVPFFAGQS